MPARVASPPRGTARAGRMARFVVGAGQLPAMIPLGAAAIVCEQEMAIR